MEEGSNLSQPGKTRTCLALGKPARYVDETSFPGF